MRVTEDATNAEQYWAIMIGGKEESEKSEAPWRGRKENWEQFT